MDLLKTAVYLQLKERRTRQELLDSLCTNTTSLSYVIKQLIEERRIKAVPNLKHDMRKVFYVRCD